MNARFGAVAIDLVLPTLLLGVCLARLLSAPPPLDVGSLAATPPGERTGAVLALVRRPPAVDAELADLLRAWTTEAPPLGRAAVWAVGALAAPAVPALRAVLLDRERDLLTRATAAVALSGWRDRADVQSWLRDLDTDAAPLLRVYVEFALRGPGR